MSDIEKSIFIEINQTRNENERLRAENEKLRAALKNIAETYNKPTTSKDGLAFMAAAALKEIEE